MRHSGASLALDIERPFGKTIVRQFRRVAGVIEVGSVYLSATRNIVVLATQNNGVAGSSNTDGAALIFRWGLELA